MIKPYICKLFACPLTLLLHLFGKIDFFLAFLAAGAKQQEQNQVTKQMCEQIVFDIDGFNMSRTLYCTTSMQEYCSYSYN